MLGSCELNMVGYVLGVAIIHYRSNSRHLLSPSFLDSALRFWLVCFGFIILTLLRLYGERRNEDFFEEAFEISER